MFHFNGNLNNNTTMVRPYKPAVPPRKRVIEEPLEDEMNVPPAVVKRRRFAVPKGVGKSIPMANKGGWWKFGGKMPKEILQEAVKTSSAQQPKALSTQNNFLQQQRLASGFQSFPPKSKLSMNSTFTSTNPNPPAHLRSTKPTKTAPPKTVVVNHLNSTSGTEEDIDDDDSLHSNADDGFSSDDNSALKFRAYQAENWTEKFEELIEFRHQYGHCLVPNSYPENSALAQWVKRQRYQFKLKNEEKRSTMSDERVRALDEIGFVWDSHSAIWEERLQELVQYKQLNGHTNVPSRYSLNKQLAVWVKRQRRQHKFYCEGKPSSMTEERIQRLGAVGLIWDMRAKK